MSKNDGDRLIHIDLSITVSENEYSFYDPKAYKNINFSMPKEMFSEAALAKMISNRIADLDKNFPNIKAEYEAKLKEEEAEKAARKAEKNVEELTEVDINALLSK
jgi:hypothetical protein